MTSWTKALVVSASFALIAFPAITLAQHGHDDGHADLLVGGDSAGVGNLLIDYPFGERPFVRVSDSGAPEGLFTAVDPGFDRAEDEPGEGVFALPAGTEISLEIVALDENIQLRMADQCPAFDINGDVTVGVNELISAVRDALDGC